MAIYHCSTKPLGRKGGRSAVAAAAYRSAECLVNERDGLTHDYRTRSGVEHTEVFLPAGVEAAWAQDRSALWNAAEAAERRSDARTAREWTVALPHELTPEQRVELVREFAQELADRYGCAVDVALHAPNRAGDERNHHAHLLTTTRRIEEDRFGPKTSIERKDRDLLAEGLPTGRMQVTDVRALWEGVANEHLARAGHEHRIDHRSHVERGLEIEPTEHQGVHATGIQRKGGLVDRGRLETGAANRNAELIRERPEQVLGVITGERSVFDRHDIARALHRALDGEPVQFQNAFARVMASPDLVRLQEESRDERGRVVEPERFTTRRMVEVERGMAEAVDRLSASAGHGIDRGHLAAAFTRQPHLADEQRAAVEHVTGAEGIAAVVGRAGAGKSTMLGAAREAWEAAGYRVHGAALAGKAAEGLEQSSGIASRTVASWERSWERGNDQLRRGDVLVVDEAGMVSSEQMARVVAAAERGGAKLVLVGDAEQLQPIQAGAAFRAIAERTGYVELEGIRRQGEAWQREASLALGKQDTVRGLAAYEAHGAVRFEDSREAARGAAVRDYLADREALPEGSRIALAHTRADVQALNEGIRAGLRERGELGEEARFEARVGARSFAAGDRVLFLENSRELGVKNGTLGTVLEAAEGRITARLDEGRQVTVEAAGYDAVDHGYATTIHKAQGATVDRAYVVGSASMDRHMAYVALTRHREGVTLYAGRDEFQDFSGLAERLSRGGLKETTLDYAAGFAERRGIVPRSEIEVPRAPEPALEPARPAEAPRRGMFAGLKLGRASEKLGRDPERPAARPEVAREPGPAARPAPDRELTMTRLSGAVDGYVRAFADTERMIEASLPVLPHQALALRRAGERLDGVDRGVGQDVRTALERQPGLARGLDTREGRAALMGAVAHERQVRQTPELRAERYAEIWKGLSAERERLNGWGQEGEQRKAVEGRMRDLAGEIKRDPQAESLMRERSRQLGIEMNSRLGRVLEAANVREAHQIVRRRSQGLSR